MSRRKFVSVFAVFLIGLTAFTPGSGADDFSNGARKFIENLAGSAVKELTAKDLGEEEREARFRKIFLSNFDVNLIGRYSLGRYWRLASSAERDQYLRLFEDLVILTYVKRFRDYTNESLEVSRATPRGNNSAIVSSALVRAGEKPVRVDWRVAFPDGQYRIVDVVVEGVSLVQTQRSEFSSVIRNNGGEISGLIKALGEKVRELEAEAK